VANPELRAVAPPLEDCRFGDLVITAHESGGVIRVDWNGKSNDRQPGKVLDPWFGRAVSRALDSHASIEMHFEGLEFFNSSTITSIIQLIQDVREKGIKLVIVFNAQLKWQKLSFDALRIFEKADGLLQLRSVG